MSHKPFKLAVENTPIAYNGGPKQQVYQLPSCSVQRGGLQYSRLRLLPRRDSPESVDTTPTVALYALAPSTSRSGRPRTILVNPSTQSPKLGYVGPPVGLLAWIYEKLVQWTDGYKWKDDEV